MPTHAAARAAVEAPQAVKPQHAETVLVLGTAQWSAQSTAFSLARSGFRVVGAWGGGRLAGRTRYCDKLCRIPPPAQLPEFSAAVEAICQREEVAAVMPLTDELSSALLATRSPGSTWVIAGPDATAFARLCDKSGLQETAARAGVMAPPSAVVTPAGAQGPLPALPAYVKVFTTANTGMPSGRPVRVSDQGELEVTVRRLVESGASVLVQEEIQGRQWRFHFARCRGRIAHLGAQTLADYPHHVGRSTVSQFGRAPDALVDRASTLLDEVGYEGTGSVQFVDREGDWFVHDVNLRMPESVAGSIASGLDLPRLATEIALAREPALEAIRIRPIRLVMLPGELLALRDALARQPVGRSAARSRSGSHQPCFAPIAESPRSD